MAFGFSHAPRASKTSAFGKKIVSDMKSRLFFKEESVCGIREEVPAFQTPMVAIAVSPGMVHKSQFAFCSKGSLPKVFWAVIASRFAKGVKTFLLIPQAMSSFGHRAFATFLFQAWPNS